MIEAARAMARGGTVRGRLFLWRDGALHTELQLPGEDPMVVDCEAGAAVKQKLRCCFYHDGEIDFVHDRLAPFLVIDGQEWPMGRYVFARCSKTSNGGESLWRATGLDLCQLMRRYVPETLPYWAAGTRYSLALAQLLAAAGVTESHIEESSLCFATAREDWFLGTDGLRIINDLLYEMNYHSLFCDHTGLVRAAPYRAPGMAEATIRYGAAAVENIHLPGSTVELDGIDHPNVFHYLCENPELAAPLAVCVENKNPASRFSVQNQGRVPVFRTVNNVASEAALRALAERELQRNLLAADEIVFATGLCPLHAAFEVVQLEKEDFVGTVHERAWKMTVTPGGRMLHRGRIVQGY